jgi:hypothetical protein
VNACKALVLSYIDEQEPGRILFLSDSSVNPRRELCADVGFATWARPSDAAEEGTVGFLLKELLFKAAE